MFLASVWGMKHLTLNLPHFVHQLISNNLIVVARNKVSVFFYWLSGCLPAGVRFSTAPDRLVLQRNRGALAIPLFGHP